jgi:hypothetical protein
MTLECFRDRGVPDLFIRVRHRIRDVVMYLSGLAARLTRESLNQAISASLDSITIVMGGVAALHVQPGPRNSFGRMSSSI